MIKSTPMTHAEQIASQLNVKPSQVTAVINLIDEGNTVPFIARYRKEMTGTLDDEQVRIVADEIIRLRALEERRASILASIEEQGKLTDELRKGISMDAVGSKIPAGNPLPFVGSGGTSHLSVVDKQGRAVAGADERGLEHLELLAGQRAGGLVHGVQSRLTQGRQSLAHA